MATQVQFRRGNTAQHSTFTGANGEITFDTDKKTVVVHDGTTAGGFPLVRENQNNFAANNLTANSTLTVTGTVSSNLTPTSNNTYSLGTTDKRWANLYLSGSTLVIGDQTITSNSTGLNLSGAFFVNGSQIANSTEIVLGANVTLTTSQLSIGNATVNTVITATGINTDGTLDVLKTATFSNNVTINGDLTVNGTQTILNTQTLAVNDNIIVLNDGTVTPTEDAGIEIDRGASNSAFLLWREVEGKWVIVDKLGIEYLIATNNDVTTAYTNATSYSSNADNISSGTLNTARLPSTANVSTSINVGANVNVNTSTISVGNSTVNTSLNAGSITVSGFQQSFVTYTSSTTALQTWDSFATASFRSAQYFVQLTSGTDYHNITLALNHNGTAVQLLQYGAVIENVSLGTFDADISGGDVILQFTPTNAVTTIKAVRTLIAV